MSEAMSAEFGTVAEWTADVALDLGADFRIPAACRGSGSPPALDWLLNRMDLTPGSVLLDAGAGLGGPAAYGATQARLRPLLVEPELGACRASRALFGLPVVRADAAALPIATGAVDAVWALGVLCTTERQIELLRELRRVVRPGAPLGLLVFVVRDRSAQQPEGNHFPSTAHLAELIGTAGLRVIAHASTADMPAVPADWLRRVNTITAALVQRYGHRHAWALAQHQSDRMADLLERGAVTGELLVARSVPNPRVGR